MTTKDKHLILNDLCTRLSYKDVNTFATSKVLKNDFCDIDGYLEQQIETYKHLQDTLSVLEGIVDVLDVVTKKINNN